MMKFFGLFILILNLILSGKHALAADQTALVGLAQAYKYKVGTIDLSVVINFPLDFSGYLVNWPSQKERVLPNHFLIGSGALLRPFYIVNKTPGTVLHKHISDIKLRIAADLRSRNANEISKEVIINYLTKNIQKFINWDAVDSRANDFGRFENSSDDRLDSSLIEKRRSLFSVPLGQWIESDQRHHLVLFEKVIESKKGYCIEMVLLTSFLLESFGIPHRVIFGSVLENDFMGSGHTWIQLNDGRIMDVSWNTLDKPILNHHLFQKNWLWFGNEKGYQYRYEYDFYPIISL